MFSFFLGHPVFTVAHYLVLRDSKPNENHLHVAALCEHLLCVTPHTLQIAACCCCFFTCNDISWTLRKNAEHISREAARNNY